MSHKYEANKSGVIVVHEEYGVLLGGMSNGQVVFSSSNLQVARIAVYESPAVALHSLNGLENGGMGRFSFYWVDCAVQHEHGPLSVLLTNLVNRYPDLDDHLDNALLRSCIAAMNKNGEVAIC